MVVPQPVDSPKNWQDISYGLREVYYYITFVCNLRCRHCYVGDNLAPQTHANLSLVLNMLQKCYCAGARKVTFLGGEPTLHPDYEKILLESIRIGYPKIIIDTNGLTQYPIPKKLSAFRQLSVRLSLEGINAQTHDLVRGQGTFDKTFASLKRLIEANVRVEVTYTINSNNAAQVSEAVRRLTDEGVSEINFHFMSLMGNGQRNSFLGLEPEKIIQAQEELEYLNQNNKIPLRYPKLLIHKEELSHEISKGYNCRIFGQTTLLIFPKGELRRCPLQITSNLNQEISVENSSESSGCPLSSRLLPNNIPEDYIMTCISWKNL
ncbi:putative Fe-S oxidoreductase [Leptolyngbya sp. PCC 7375]|nr:putative Fe-S oxidoreductase [Leptolyngbya sp. PCC 7375]